MRNWLNLYVILHPTSIDQIFNQLFFFSPGGQTQAALGPSYDRCKHRDQFHHEPSYGQQHHQHGG